MAASLELNLANYHLVVKIGAKLPPRAKFETANTPGCLAFLGHVLVSEMQKYARNVFPD